MKKGLAYAGVLLALLVGALLTPQRASAQLLPPLPGGSLIVTVTSPSSGATVSGTIPVNASVSIVGTLTVSRIEFFVDGNFIGSDSGEPYSVSWNTTNVGNGSHTLVAVGVDILGIRWNSNSVTVTVNNDTTPPTVSITSPANGATVSGTITVSANASDNVGVAGVRFLLDGTNLGAEDTSAPYSVSWNTTGAANGSHTLTAVARDAAGNTRTSTPVTVTVANIPPPTISGFSPTSGPVGTSVTLNGTNFSGASAVRFNGTSASFTVSSATSISATVPSGATSGTISVTTAGGTATSSGSFTVLQPPTISGFTPTSGPVGTSVTISGTNFSGASAVRFNGTSASFTVSSATAIQATVPAGATTGLISVTAPGGTASSASAFTVTASPPTISSFSPTSGPVGTSITISGTNFSGASAVRFNGTSASFTVSSATAIQATVPAGATTGLISVTAPGGTATSAGAFTVAGGGAPLTRFEENHSTVSSSPAGAWVQQGQDVGSFSGGAAVSSNVSGAVASFTFTGKAVSWIGLKCNVCGIATVSIDGGAPVPVDTAGPFGPNPKLKSETLFAASLADGTHTLTITVTGTSTSGGNHIVVDALDVAGSSASPIVVENLFPGSENFQMRRPGFQPPADDGGKQIKAYASATSVNKGESITFFVTVTPAQEYTMDVYRMGWYQGLGGRLLKRIGPLPGVLQPACPVDAATGLIECEWTPSHTLTVEPTWTSGVYVVQLTNALGYQTYITFVMRDDARRADILYQQSVTTYQAYNNYPNDFVTGKSLYDFNSHGANPSENPGSPRAVKVSWNRPYSGEGAGEFFNWEHSFVRWLERSGYDVAYSTNIDTHQRSERLLNYKAFLSVGHDEYWSKPMYDGVEAARDAGVHLGFFGADAVFWQVRFEPSPLTGAADRVMVGYKNRSLDPVQGPTTTVLWRDPFLNRPEQRLVGVQFSGQVNNGEANTNVPYVVTNSSSWVYQGTGLTDGSSIPGMVGYEADTSMPDAPLPTSVPGTYQVLSQSPYNEVSGPSLVANSSIYQAPSGAWVFGAGTISWSWGLDLPGVVHPGIQRTTANLLNRFLGISSQPVPLQP